MTNRLTIHATNIRGTGATNVILSLVGSLKNKLKDREVKFYLPGKSNSFAKDNLGNFKIYEFKRKLPSFISRFSECLLSSWYFAKADSFLILGDLPLNGLNQQVVLVHQSNLIDPKINPYSGKSLKYKFQRWIFKSNLKYVKQVVVQTEVMKHQLIASYPELLNRVTVIPHPAPVWCSSNSKTLKKEQKPSLIVLFYPVTNYSYKNLQIFELMESWISRLNFPLQIVVTLDPSELPASIANLNWIKCVGKLSSEDCLKQYEQVTGLFFPSLLESYGLPLLEAMTLGLPIICSDLPYARWLCEDQAIYFNPHCGKSASNAIEELRRRVAGGWQVNWQKALAKISKDWDEVAERFLCLLK